MSKGVMKTKPKQKPTADLYANLSILELMDGITNTTEDLQEVIREIAELNEDTAVWEQQVERARNDYLEEKAGYEEHLKRLEQLVQKKKFLYAELADYSDAFKNRMD